MKRLSRFSIQYAAIFSVVLTVVFSPVVADGLSLTDTSATFERQEINELSNHEFAFTTPSGINIGETVRLIYPFDFGGIASITDSDISITSGGIVVPGTSWSSVSNASEIIITFTSAIAAASDMIFVIGGTNQISNPSTAGSYAVDIQGTFADSGFSLVPILSDDQVHVSAKVVAVTTPVTPSSGGSSGGGSRRCTEGFCLYDDVDNDSLVRLEGWSHPFGLVEVYSPTGYLTTVTADGNGFFSIELQSFATGDHTLVFVGTDDDDLRSIITPIGFGINYNTITVIDDVLLAPTIELLNVQQPGTALFRGVTIPGAEVDIFLNGIYWTSTTANDDGSWSYELTNMIENREYLITVRGKVFGLQSQLSTSVAAVLLPENIELSFVEEFFVPGSDIVFNRKNLCLTGDLSNDGLVSLQDLSIASYWSDYAELNDQTIPYDQWCLNEDQKFDLADLSIISYYWSETWQRIETAYYEGNFTPFDADASTN